MIENTNKVSSKTNQHMEYNTYRNGEMFVKERVISVKIHLVLPAVSTQVRSDGLVDFNHQIKNVSGMNCIYDDKVITVTSKVSKGVSNQRQSDCLFNCLFKLTTKRTSKICINSNYTVCLHCFNLMFKEKIRWIKHSCIYTKWFTYSRLWSHGRCSISISMSITCTKLHIFIY